MKKIIGHYRKCDMLTMFGTFCSFMGIILTLNEHYTISILLLLISGICDGFDGTLARKYEYSEEQKLYGVQLDSLSDVICFGCFPAIITVAVSRTWITYVIAALYLLCGVVRLAYFNTMAMVSKSKKKIFIGFPITTSAIIYPIIFFIIRLINFDLLKIVIPILLVIIGAMFIVRIEIPKPDVPALLKRIFNKYVINLLLMPLFIILGSDLFYKLNYYTMLDSINGVINNVIHNFYPFIMVYIIIALIIIVLNLIFKKVHLSKIILFSLIALILIINDIKLNIMGIPFELSDVNYLNPDNMSMMGTATTSIGTWIYLTIIKAIVFMGISFVFIKLSNEKIIVYKNKLKNIIIIYLCLFGILLIIFVLFRKGNFAISKIYRTNMETILQSNTCQEMYDSYGLYQGLILSQIAKNETKVKGYSREKVYELYNNLSESTGDKWQKANIVFILSEAFSDVRNIPEIAFDKNVMSNIDSYKLDSNKKVVDLLVPSYGGVSVNTEFEILTGGSINFFTAGFIPYTQYYNNINGSFSPSIIKELNNNGYETMYLTPWGEDSYKSSYVYSLYQVNKKIYGNELKGEKKGEYYSDKSLMEDIYNQLKDTKVGNYKFIMSATGQNHYPYDGKKYKNYDINIESTKLNKEDSEILRSYAQGIYDADKELNNLYEKIQELEVPTVIVFFGDHLPYTVDSKGDDPYLKSEYLNTDNKYLNLLRKHTTKAVILSNYDISFNDFEYINASYLGTYIINKMDLDISDYYKFVYQVMNEIPVFNRNSILIGDKLININEVEKNNDKMIALNNYKYVQYNGFYDYNGR